MTLNHWYISAIFQILLLIFSTLSEVPPALVAPSNNDRQHHAHAKRHLLSQSDHLDLIRRYIPLLANKTLVVCAVVREPFVIYNEPSTTTTATTVTIGNLTQTVGAESAEEARANLDNYSGVAIEVVRRLSLIFGFSIRIIRPRDNQFGVYQADRNEWTGLMGVLARREADIGVTALSITMSRAQTIDFTRAYYVETVAILLRTPEEVQNYLAIFEPFSLGVWLCLLASIVLLIALITIMTKLEDDQRQRERMHKLTRSLWRARRREASHSGGPHGGGGGRLEIINNNHDELRSPPNKLVVVEQHEFGSSWLERFYYAVSCVINILLIRDIKHPPHQTPIRILVCVWWLSTIVIVNIYLGILFGQLVVPRRTKSIETLEELVNQDQIAWCVTRGSAIYELFKQSDPATVYGQLGQRMRQVSSADEGVQRVVQSNWAFIRERSILTFKVAKEHNRLKACRMQFAREEFYSVGFGLGLVKRSKYLEPFNSALTLMIENGFVSRWQSMYWPRRNQYTECKLQATEGQPLSMKHFISIYLVCSALVGLSATILIYQYVHEHLVVAQFKRWFVRWGNQSTMRR